MFRFTTKKGKPVTCEASKHSIFRFKTRYSELTGITFPDDEIVLKEMRKVFQKCFLRSDEYHKQHSSNAFYLSSSPFNGTTHNFIVTKDTFVIKTYKVNGG